MIDINELRRLAQAATHPTTKGRWMRLFGERTVYDRMEDGCRGVPIVATNYHPPSPQEAAYLDFIAAANPAAISELLDRLEAAEKSDAESLTMYRKSRDERDALRAKIAEMEKQAPVAWRTFGGEGGYDYRSYEDNENYKLGWDARNPNHIGWVEPLYALPGAKGE